VSEARPEEDSLVDALDQALAAHRSGRTWQALLSTAERDRAPLEGLLATQNLLLDAASEWIRTTRDTQPELPATGPYQAAALVYGRYRVEAQIGVGGMGTVHRAHDPELGRTVAIKVPRMEGTGPGRADYVARFLREARSAATVRHPNVCPIYDVGEQDGIPYVVLAYVEGSSLAQRLRAGGRFEGPAEAVVLARQLAEGLAAVHAHGLVHRDVKPANVLIDSRSTPLLTDFGLARSSGEARLTQTGVIAGTPAYMSPEQARGEEVGPASDLYSLGIVLYEMLVGTVPHAGGPVSVMLHKILHGKPLPLTRARPDIDPALAALVERALAREPEDRFPDAQAFADALGHWLDSAARGGPESPRRKRRGWVLVALPLLLALVALALTLRTGGPFPEAAGTPAVAPVPANRAALDGELRVLVFSPPGQKPAKRGLLVDQEGALPVKNGELIHLEVRLTRPAYVYLVWIGSQGETIPLYPWDAERSRLLWKAPLLEGSQKAVARLHCPAVESEGFRVKGPDGLETAILLARETPLDDPGALEHWIGRLPATAYSDPREVAWIGLGPNGRAGHDRAPLFRGLEVGAVEKVDVPLFALLEDRLRSRFELLKAVRFAHASR
jgi:serine/threonine-protein kinase